MPRWNLAAAVFSEHLKAPDILRLFKPAEVITIWIFFCDAHIYHLLIWLYIKPCIKSISLYIFCTKLYIFSLTKCMKSYIIYIESEVKKQCGFRKTREHLPNNRKPCNYRHLRHSGDWNLGEKEKAPKSSNASQAKTITEPSGAVQPLPLFK